MSQSPKPVSNPAEHDFMVDAWWGRHDTSRQREFRKIAPMPFGAVLIARDEMDEEEVRWHLKTMKQLGFNSIKQFMGCTRWSTAKLEAMALEEGLVAWWYGQGGWEAITDELCEKLGIDPSLPISEIREHPAMVKHQQGVLENRVGWERIKANPEMQAGFHGKGSTQKPGSRAFGTDASMPEIAIPYFIEWLKETYENDIAKLNAAWNTDVMRGPLKRAYETFEEIAENNWVEAAREYGRVRDCLRFKAAMKAEEIGQRADASLERDRYEPNRSGGEMGIFLPFASRGTDMELIADEMARVGSFYPSIHLCWHFEETAFEVARPVYMQACSVVDWNKGGWTAPWESTGGPQQTSGAKAFLFPWMEDEQPGFTVDENVMTQLLFSYLAAGCKGAGLWSWNARLAGFEGGEYALLDRNEQVCDRTKRVGEIAVKANQYRDEIWESVREPQVGILVDFDNEAIWAAMSQNMRTIFKYRGVEGRIGSGRACIDANLTMEHVSGADIRAGLVNRYPILYLPAVLGLNKELLPILTDYVKQGGRLVMDMPGGCYDETGRVMWTRKGTDFEQLFGCEFSDLQYSKNNVEWFLDGQRIEGYTADLTPTTGIVKARYDHGKPAVIENTLGKGTATILGWEAARACYKPGQTWWQDRLVEELLGGAEPFYICEGGVMAYRLAGPAADHYFLVNEGEAKRARFTRLPYDYTQVTDVMADEVIDIREAIEVSKDNGVWIRAVK